MPNMYMYRPADPIETAAAYSVAVSSRETPTTVALTRQSTTILESSSFEGAKNGGYVLSDNGSDLPDIILIATGSEVSLVVDAAEELRKGGKIVRVVSMPCLDVYEEQTDEYKEHVLLVGVPKTKRVAVEAGSSLSWYKYAENFVCIDRFGASGAGDEKVMEYFGLTVDSVVEQAQSL
jgi:transketolase